MTESKIGKCIVDTAIHNHRELGPGLLETVYENILAHEIRRQGLHVEQLVPVAIEYHGLKFDRGFRADLIIENKILLELKCRWIDLCPRKATPYLSPSNRHETGVSIEFQ